MLVETRTQTIQQLALIIHKDDVLHETARTARPAMGSRSVNSVPTPTLLCTLMSPPCLSTKMEWVMARP